MAGARTMKDYETPHAPTWCPGCGNISIWIAMRTAFTNLGIDPDEAVVTYGVGCSSNENNFVKTYAFHGLHGRPLPLGIGARLANHKLPVIVVGGDGDGYGEGTNHFIHGPRGNVNVTYLVHDNQIYGLTTGQNSPTTEKGQKSKTNPNGVLEEPLKPLVLSIHNGATYVARGFAGDAKQLASIIEGAITHEGFAHVDVLQPCVTFNKLNTFSYFQQRVYDLDEEKGYDKTDRAQALAKAEEWGDKIPTGVLYQVQKPTLESQIHALREKPLVEHDLTNIDISESLEELT